jgi:hypothetical protein
MQHAKRMRHIVLSFVARRAVPYFSTLSLERLIFGKKVLAMKCVPWFFLQILSEIFHILKRIQRCVVTNLYRSSCKEPMISCLILMEPEFSGQNFRKIFECQITRRSDQWEPSYPMQTDGLMDGRQI